MRDSRPGARQEEPHSPQTHETLVGSLGRGPVDNSRRQLRWIPEEKGVALLPHRHSRRTNHADGGSDERNEGRERTAARRAVTSTSRRQGQGPQSRATSRPSHSKAKDRSLLDPQTPASSAAGTRTARRVVHRTPGSIPGDETNVRKARQV